MKTRIQEKKKSSTSSVLNNYVTSNHKVNRISAILLILFTLIPIVSYGHVPIQEGEEECREFFHLLRSELKSSTSMEVQRKYFGPFTTAKIDFIKVRDSDGDYSYYVSGNKPAYFYNSTLEHEYFFAGEMEETNALLSGELKIFTPFGWKERIGYFNEDGVLEIGAEVSHSYFENKYPELMYRTKSTGTKCFDILSETAMYEIIDQLKHIEFDDEEDYPKYIKPLPNNLSPRIFTKSYCVERHNKLTQSRSLVTSSKPKGLTTAGKLFTAATLFAAVGLAAKAFSDDSRSSFSSSSSSSSASTPTDLYSKGNVEIVSWGTLGALALSHAKVDLRNKNNYDVNVTISLYQDGWSLGEIIYSEYENSDRIPGVSDNYSTTIRVKANSIRSVYLKADHRGRPTHIRINSVY